MRKSLLLAGLLLVGQMIACTQATQQERVSKTVSANGKLDLTVTYPAKPVEWEGAILSIHVIAQNHPVDTISLEDSTSGMGFTHSIDYGAYSGKSFTFNWKIVLARYPLTRVARDPIPHGKTLKLKIKVSNGEDKVWSEILEVKII